MYRLLRARESDPARVAVIGAGKFSSMFLAQVRTAPGMRVVGVCDLASERAEATLRRSGWSAEEIAAIALYPDAEAVIRQGDPEVVVEATGDPVAPLKAYDSLQLAGCLMARRGTPTPVTFVCADARLCDAARVEGLTVLNPISP